MPVREEEVTGEVLMVVGRKLNAVYEDVKTRDVLLAWREGWAVHLEQCSGVEFFSQGRAVNRKFCCQAGWFSVEALQ
jgi:hypothetical protein